MLKSISLKNVGPSDRLDAEFGSRFNIVTGDNGLGKTFLLDAIWFGLTYTRPREKALSVRVGKPIATISCQLSKGFNNFIQFDVTDFLWRPRPLQESRLDELVIYVRLDGSMEIWDPLRNHRQLYPDREERIEAFQFDANEIWQGAKSRSGTLLCAGLLSDWVSWQKGNEQSWHELRSTLAILSEDATASLMPGPPKRIAGSLDAMEYPTLQMPYGDLVLAPDWPAGFRRIASIAYALVWAKSLHLEAAADRAANRAPGIVLLIDEIEAHLHPRWQRKILPALLAVAQKAGSSASPFENWTVQVIGTTHSPLVLASLEPEFDQDQDTLHVFEMRGSTKSVELKEIPWSMQGDVSNWLASESFDLKQARSLAAERAIEAAEALMRNDIGALPHDLATREQIHQELLRVLPSHDDFWPRWIVSQHREEPVSSTR